MALNHSFYYNNTQLNSDLTSGFNSINARINKTDDALVGIENRISANNIVSKSKAGYFGDDGIFTATKDGILFAVHELRCVSLQNYSTGFIAVEIAINDITISRDITSGGTHYYDGANCACIYPICYGDTIKFRVDRNTDTTNSISYLKYVII